MKPQTCLILYTELAEYLLACVRELANRGIEVHLVHWKVNKEAPFKLSAPEGVHFHQRDKFEGDALLKLAKQISPQIIVCSGWVDKDYLKVCKKWKGKAITVMTMDNHWTNSLKQKVASLIGPLYLQQRFTHAWVPGKPQVRYAQKLGFPKHRILKGFYSADYEHFHELGNALEKKRKEGLPKRFLYLGRYVQHKGIFELWEAFIQLQEEQPNEWELWCIGTGDQFEERLQHPKIKHFGFVQPNDLGKYLKDVGVFVLPSHFEPWGVVVHEMAAAGFPMLCSEEVGAASLFLETGKNGFQFPAKNMKALKKAMSEIIKQSPKELEAMGAHSSELAKLISPSNWADTLLQAAK